MKALGKNICYQLKKHNLTQKYLAWKLGVTESAVSRWCRGEREPRVSIVYKMSRIFGCTMDELMGLPPADEPSQVARDIARIVENEQDMRVIAQSEKRTEMHACDYIERQAAIDTLRDYLVGRRCPDDGTLTCRLIENEVINKLPTIHHEHGTNMAEVGTDCISRKAAIDAVEESRRLNHHEDGKEACAHEYEHRHFLKILRDLPTVEPQIIRCKDCEYYIVHRKKRGVVPVCGLLKGTPIRHDDDFCSRAERRTE